MFSVIIPLFNKEKEIIRCLDSIFQQTYKSYEIIIIDDGSTDNSVRMINKLYGSLVRLVSIRNQGVSFARNLGIKKANNEYVVFIDADDEWLPNHLKTLKSLIDKYPNCGLYATSYIVKIKDIGSVKKYCNDGLVKNYFDLSRPGDQKVWTSCACIPRGVFLAIGGFIVGISHGEDVEMWGRVALHYKVCTSSEQTGIYHKDNLIGLSQGKIKEVYPFIPILRSKIDNQGFNYSEKTILSIENHVDAYEWHLVKLLLKEGNVALLKSVIGDSLRYKTNMKKIIYILFLLLPKVVLKASVRYYLRFKVSN
jgi:glycosyltransferase involved in cell wall biosynthesis